MKDRAWTTVLAWPYPGRKQLPTAVLDELAAHILLPLSDIPIEGSWCAQPGAFVLSGDAQTGPILGLSYNADLGLSEFRTLIEALLSAGLHVFAGNEPGESYCGCWEYHAPHPADDPGATACHFQWRQWDGEEFMVTAPQLLTNDRPCLEQIPDQELATAVRELLSPPTAVPEAVLSAAPCCF